MEPNFQATVRCYRAFPGARRPRTSQLRVFTQARGLQIQPFRRWHECCLLGVVYRPGPYP
jgi:hypothetical protein